MMLSEVFSVSLLIVSIVLLFAVILSDLGSPDA